MKDLVAENDRLKKDLDYARKQVATLRTDLVGKDKEITQLKGQLTKIQGELTALFAAQAATHQGLHGRLQQLAKDECFKLLSGGVNLFGRRTSLPPTLRGRIGHRHEAPGVRCGIDGRDLHGSVDHQLGLQCAGAF